MFLKPSRLLRLHAEQVPKRTTTGWRDHRRSDGKIEKNERAKTEGFKNAMVLS